MRAFGNNILSKSASDYKLNNAHITDNQLVFLPGGGKAIMFVSKARLPKLTEFFKVNILAAPPSNSYETELTLSIDIITQEDAYLNYVCNLYMEPQEAYTSVLETVAGDFKDFTVTITASNGAILTLWELCPELQGDTETIIDNVKQSLPRLLFDYNTTELTVVQKQTIVAMINCILIENTDLQGHFLINFYSSERCNVYLRFWDNEMIELFSPLTHTINAGHNTLEVPHAYLKKLKGLHNFFVTAQCSNGKLNVPIRGVLYTIDGGYLADRKMNPGMDVQDVTIKQLPSDNSPSEIWAIGVDNGRALVKKRLYANNAAGSSWEGVFDLGEALGGAIEFDGEWIRRKGRQYYTLETESLPSIALITSTKNLIAYHNGINTPPKNIDENVTMVSMVRGYKSTRHKNQDQGLIICWVKEKNVYYQQYLYTGGEYRWGEAEQLTTSGDVLFAQVHRLNDYRVGIVVRTENENHWYISDRTYISAAVEPENLDVSTTGTFSFAPLTLEEDATFKHEAEQNDLKGATEPQDTFILTFPGVERVSFVDKSEDTSKNVKVFVDLVPIDADDYTVKTEGPSLIIKLKTPVWGKVIIEWRVPGMLWMHFSHRRRLVNTHPLHSYEWDIQRRFKLTPEDKLLTDVSYNLILNIFETPQNKYLQKEELLTEVDYQMNFDIIPLNEIIYNIPTENLSANVSYTLTFKMTQTGELPI